jgi:flagella basal body P-ring formation protein FlgA
MKHLPHRACRALHASYVRSTRRCLLLAPLLLASLLTPPCVSAQTTAQATPAISTTPAPPAIAAIAITPAHQDPALIRQAAEQFLQAQTTGLPGQVRLTIGALDQRLKLAACAAPQAFSPPGSRLWGKTTVGVRCLTPSSWTIYLQATVSVMADYIASAAPLVQGQLIGPGQLIKMTGELTTLPSGIVTDMSQALGRTVTISLPAGAPLRLDVLRNQTVVQQGQVVRLTSIGPGFRVSAEARAMGNASEGQVVQVKTLAGQQISGIAKAGGAVEVVY